MTIEITDWDKNYETRDSRRRPGYRFTWLAIPVKLSGSSYGKLISHADGAAHFGVWNSLLQLAATCKKRGILARDSGEPYTPESISFAVRIPEAMVNDAIIRLIGLGWLKYQEHQDSGNEWQRVADVGRNVALTVTVTSTSTNTKECGESFDSPPIDFLESQEYETAIHAIGDCLEDVLPIPWGEDSTTGTPATKKRKSKGSKQQGNVIEEWFKASFWDKWPSHPRKKDRYSCLNFCSKLSPDQREELSAGLIRHLPGLLSNLDYIPLPMTWLNKRRWLDVIEGGNTYAGWLNPKDYYPPMETAADRNRDPQQKLTEADKEHMRELGITVPEDK